MSIAELLKKLISNPDDLSQLPQIIAQVEKLESAEVDYQARIQKLQEINRSYLAQIPIPTEKAAETVVEEEEPTIEMASKLIIESLTGGK